MNWTDTTPDAVDGAWNSHATRVDEHPTEMDALNRLRESRFVKRNILNVISATSSGFISLPDAISGVIIAALRTGWYVRNDAEANTELATLLTDAEVEELRKEIASVTTSSERDTRMDA